jgi:TRAP-type C4-dicarboxylate transport system permease small subunit
MRILKYIMDRVFAVLTWFALALLVAMTLIIFCNVFCRYVLNFSLAWADEMSLILLIWFVFISLAIGVRMKYMVAIDMINALCPSWKTLDRVATHVVNFLTFAFGIMLIYFGWELIKIGSFSTLASFDVPTYWEYVFIPVSGVLVMYSALIHLFRSASALPEEDYLDKIFLKKAETHV